MLGLRHLSVSTSSDLGISAGTRQGCEGRGGRAIRLASPLRLDVEAARLRGTENVGHAQLVPRFLGVLRLTKLSQEAGRGRRIRLASCQGLDRGRVRGGRHGEVDG